MNSNAVIEETEPAWLDQLEPPELLIVLAGRQMQDMMNAELRRHGLKLVEWRILQGLKPGGTVTICDLAEMAVADRTVASRLVDKLSERGLLLKKALKTDRRFAQVSLSAMGRKLLDAAEPDVRQARERLFAGMSFGEANALNKTLMKFISNTKLNSRARR
ncbi:MarR family transcriptional regulator [Sulfitobacter sp. F26204]|uniref:MarR family winged helix-turn-helix transcriptional regulator n=1 Tax=Sulfitobacter sp. F26204 TaxID=2996014 RepID=UPI00225DF999|nr:MarR family transcriptional regulator [Sulfitobacter sp. F26204]MCX7561752.1 MarR family transcriptional regulator [Sulfitobacter sp. F26204]